MRNLLVIVCDTLRRDHLGCYGRTSTLTPNLDRMAGESIVFDRAYCCSFPTLPCRAELFTGSFVFPYLDWGPLPTREPVLSETLADAGFTCTLVTDNLPLCREGYGYDRGFHARHRVRGQWYDNFQPDDAPFRWPCSPEKLSGAMRGRIEQYLRNVAVRRSEEDYFAPQVVGEAIHWLERNHDRGRFYLHVEIFDPHEPWDPPPHYLEPGGVTGCGEDVIYPTFLRAGEYAPDDLHRMRALYGGEVAMVDHWIGRLLSVLEGLGRHDDTAVVLLSDHGIMLGERGLVGKMAKRKSSLIGWPIYNEVARIPLLFRVPGIGPGRRDAFAHPGNVAPTLLDLAGVTVPTTMRAPSLMPVLRGEEPQVQDAAVSSWPLRKWSAYRPSVIRTEEWTMVFWRSGIAPELYHVPSDPDEEDNVYAANRAVARDLHRRYLEFLRDNETPPRHYLPRTWLVSWDGKGSGPSRLFAE